MIDPEELRQSWNLLSTFPAVVGDLQVREIEGLSLPAGPTLLGIDSQQQRHLLVPVPAGLVIQEDRHSAGLHIVSRSYIDKAKTHDYVDVVCRKPHLHELFTVITGEMLNKLGEDPSRPDITCARVLARWRELLEREPSSQITLERQIGLFGELWHLREIVRSNPSAVSTWAGPTGGRHDFVAADIALEVKSTLTRHGRFFEIHGPDQLDAPPSGRLFLGTLKLEKDGSKDESIPSLVDSITALGTDNHTLLTLLSHAGISPAELHLYEETRFRVLENRVYSVTEDFPKITPQSFAGGMLPGGVLNVYYQIDLSSEPPSPLPIEEVRALYSALASGTTL